ncbi:NADase-type glycan-binding domain-containing protein [Actinokineospora enzanensis]|uniref:NADase-type glycan-binding domain-containing protein n=1 Tax=Actinokineospora enzanensis TaxID=155975 RepID=UPI0003A26492|nr:zinc-ribbon domain-containing protein [Actinokineospora enzanensis]
MGPTDDFCGNCGTYLGWGETGAPQQAVTPRTTPEPPGDIPGTPPGAESPAQPPTSPQAESPASPQAAEPSSPQAPDRGKPTPARGSALVQPPARPPSEPAQASPAAGPDPEDTDPRPVQPARPVAPRPAKRVEIADTAVEGPPCPNCGTPNPPGRKFCRRCATPLTETAEETRTAQKSRKAGGSGALTRRLILLALLIALVIAGIALYPLGKRLVQDVLDKTSKTVPAVPVSVSATAELPGHPAKAATDGATNKYWGSPAVGASLEATFDQPIRLLTVVTHTGPSAKPEEFATEARPTLLDATVTTADGTTQSFSIPLADEPGPQQQDTAISDVVKIQLTVRAAAGLGPGKHIALGEVEFFRRG